ncbi:MAG: HAD family acid phosphatase [Calditrichia bacterium]|nr:HAD family acid phosphatase [Calditrichia bacterium]
MPIIHTKKNGLSVKFEEIKKYITESKKEKVKYAVVMDIDETTLSNLEFELRYGFGFAPGIWHEWIMEANAKAIPASKKFFDWALKNKIAIFFVTGRRAVTDKIEDDPTAINLKKEGFTGYKKLYLKPKTGKIITIEYKSSARKEIMEMGYTIIANIGDQWSDLEGGYAKKSFKLPNPMYFVD